MSYNFIPASDNLLFPDSKREGSSSVLAGVKLLSVEEGTSVMHLNFGAKGRVGIGGCVFEVLHRVLVNEGLWHVCVCKKDEGQNKE